MKIDLRWFVVAVLASSALIVSCTRSKDGADNTVYASFSANVKGLDPIYANDVYSNEVVSHIYEGLYAYHYLKRPLQVEPRLAEALPQVSADGLVHTIKLRKGIRFADNPAFPEGKGREVKAKDFIYSWKRLADPSNQSDGFWIFDGKIKGLNEWRKSMEKKEATYDTEIEGLSAPDDYTIVIKLTRPFFQLQYVLTMGYSMVVPREVVEKHGKEFLNYPVGTGPFMVSEWVRNNKITLVKNPNWGGQTYPTEGEPGDKEKGLLADAGKPLPFVDKVVFNEIIEDQPRWLNFIKGNLDFTGIPKDNFDGVIENGKLKEEMAKKGIALAVSNELDLVYIGFNMNDPILGKKLALRKAISLAYDRDTFIKKFYNGRAIKSESPIPPGVDGYDPNFKNPNSEFNLEKARELLKEAGYPEGKGLPEFTYDVTSSTTARQMAEFFQQNMAQIGIKIKVNTSSWPQFQSRLKQNKGQIWGVGWIGDYPDAENFLQLLYGPNKSPGPNDSAFQNAEFDELYKKSSVLPPGPERTALHKKMRDIFVEQVPWSVTAHRIDYNVRHGWVENFKRSQTVNDWLKYVRVDVKKRASLKAKL